MKYLLVALLLVGCAEKKTTYWQKPGAGEQEFNADMGYCRAQAFGVPGAMNNLMQVAMVQNSCMQGKGWYTVQR